MAGERSPVGRRGRLWSPGSTAASTAIEHESRRTLCRYFYAWARRFPMPDEVQQSRTTSWSDWFPNFTPLFRAFGMSHKLNQLGAALGAVLLIFLWGLLLDAVWPTSSGSAVTIDGGHVTN